MIYSCGETHKGMKRIKQAWNFLMNLSLDFFTLMLSWEQEPATRRGMRFHRKKSMKYSWGIYICDIIYSASVLLPIYSEISWFIIPCCLYSLSLSRRNNNAPRNREGPIEEREKEREWEGGGGRLRKRECNVIRTVHCRMTRLYIDRGGGVGGGETTGKRGRGRRVRRHHPPSPPPATPSPGRATKPRDEKTLI